MQAKLEKALHKVFNPQANDIVKGLKKELGSAENVIAKKQEITLSKGLPHDFENQDPNRGDFHPSQ